MKMLDQSYATTYAVDLSSHADLTTLLIEAGGIDRPRRLVSPLERAKIYHDVSSEWASLVGQDTADIYRHGADTAVTKLVVTEKSLAAIESLEQISPEIYSLELEAAKCHMANAAASALLALWYATRNTDSVRRLQEVDLRVVIERISL